AAASDVGQVLVDVLPRAIRALVVAVALNGSILPPPLAAPLSNDRARGVELGLRRLVRLVVARERDATPRRVVTPGVRAAPVEAHPLVGTAGREHDDVVGDAGTEPGLTDAL